MYSSILATGNTETEEKGTVGKFGLYIHYKQLYEIAEWSAKGGNRRSSIPFTLNTD